MVRNRPGLVVAILGLAWLSAAAAGPISERLLRGTNSGPVLPVVYSVPWNPNHDVVSSVPALWLAVALTLLVAGVAEIAKAQYATRSDLALFLLALGFQVVAAAEVFASCAPDWAAYVVSLALYRGRREVWPSAFPGAPWLSLLILGITAAYLVVSGRRQSPDRHRPDRAAGDPAATK